MEKIVFCFKTDSSNKNLIETFFDMQKELSEKAQVKPGCIGNFFYADSKNYKESLPEYLHYMQEFKKRISLNPNEELLIADENDNLYSLDASSNKLLVQYTPLILHKNPCRAALLLDLRMIFGDMQEKLNIASNDKPMIDIDSFFVAEKFYPHAVEYVKKEMIDAYGIHSALSTKTKFLLQGKTIEELEENTPQK